MDSTDELTRLAEAKRQLKEQHSTKKKRTRRTLQKRTRPYPKKGQDRPKTSISTAERKRRTRRLILMGSYMEHITVNDEAAKDRLMKGLDSFLERDRDRALFDLPPKEVLQ